MTEIVDKAKKVGDNRFQGADLEEIQEQIDTTPEEAQLIEDKLMEMSVTKPEPDHEEETGKL